MTAGMGHQAASAPALPADWRERPRYTGPATFMRTEYRPDASDVDIALVGVPFDLGQTFRPGTRHGPQSVREASHMVRRMNPVTQVVPTELQRVADIGDVALNPLSLPLALEQIAAFFRSLSDRDIAAVAVGGDHTITLPIIRALNHDGPIALVQFDAHSDMWDEFYGVREMNATGFRRLVDEGLVDPALFFQVGLRGTRGDEDDIGLALERGINVIEVVEFDQRGPDSIIQQIRETIGDHPVYVSFDIDGLDPTEAPGTGVPEPGGMTMREVQRVLRGFHGMNVIGGDVCEVNPLLDSSTRLTSINGANIMFEITCLLATARAARVNKRLA